MSAAVIVILPVPSLSNMVMGMLKGWTYPEQVFGSAAGPPSIIGKLSVQIAYY